MYGKRMCRTMLVALVAAAALTAACNDDEVIAVYTCGDGVCGIEEDPSTCSADCVDTCGNGVCNPGEDAQSCPGDCPADCGNGGCGPEENAIDCPIDCAGPLFPGPCTADSTAVLGASPNKDEAYEYAMVEGELQVTIVRYDPGEDVESAEINYFDEEGFWVGQQYDAENDGVIDWMSEFRYDSAGRRTEYSEQAMDGSSHRETTYTYDATGYLAHLYTTDLVASGNDIEAHIEWNGDYTFRLDHYDHQANGSVDWTNERTYDATGNLIHEYSGEYDQEVFLVYDQEQLSVISPVAMVNLPWRLLEQQRVRLLEWTADWGDGNIRQMRFFYDEHGNLLRTEYGRDPAPPPPRWFTSFYYDCWM